MVRFAFYSALCLLLLGRLYAASHWNVLFLVVDDLRPKLNCYGETNMVTPNLDNLAVNSVLFQRAYCQQAVCSPSRTSFLTGRRPDTTRIFDLSTYFRRLAGNFTTLPQHFKNNGYITECPGSDGLQDNVVCPVKLSDVMENTLPDIQSSDTAIQFLQNRSLDQQPFFLGLGYHKPHTPYKFPEEFLKLYPMSKIHPVANPDYPPWLPHVAYSPWQEMRSYHDISSMNLTWPFQRIPDPYQLKIRQAYSAAISYIDREIGRVLQALDQLGLTTNTIVTFLGDHGYELGEHNHWTKKSNFDLATRIPLMVHVPGVTTPVNPPTPPGHTFPFYDALASTKSSNNHLSPCSSAMCSNEQSRSRGTAYHATDALVEAVDLYATVSELAGLGVPDLSPDSRNVPLCTEGTSLVPLIQRVMASSKSPQALSWKSAAFSQFPRPSEHIQTNSDLPPLKDIRVMGYTMKTATHRYTEWVAYDPVTFTHNMSHVYARELYDHSNDPEENLNLADDWSSAAVVAQLSQQLRAGWRKALPETSD